MAASTLKIQYLGTGSYALDIKVGASQFIRHSFTPGEILDITDICTLDELNRTSFVALSAAGTFTPLFTRGTDDISVPAGDIESADIATGAITTAKLDALAVTAAKIAADAVTTVKILDSNVTAGKLASDAVTTVKILAANVTAPKISVVDADGLSPLCLITKTFAAAAAGTADDVTIYSANAPFAFQIVDSWAYVTTAISAKTVTARSASAGGGSAKTDAFDFGTTGVVRNLALTALPSSTAAGGSLFLRRSDRGVAGTVVLLVQKV